jgi:hypothetical protein
VRWSGAGNRKTTEDERLILEHFKAAEGDADATKAIHKNAASAAQAHSAQHAAQRSRITMYEAREAASADLFAARASLMAEREKPLEQRDRDAAPLAAVHSSIRAAEEAAFKAMEARYAQRTLFVELGVRAQSSAGGILVLSGQNRRCEACFESLLS